VIPAFGLENRFLLICAAIPDYSFFVESPIAEMRKGGMGISFEWQ
jgi:hypothetical protein